MADARIKVLARVVTHGPRYDRITNVVLEENARIGLRDIKIKGVELLRQRAQVRKQLANNEAQAKGVSPKMSVSHEASSGKNINNEEKTTRDDSDQKHGNENILDRSATVETVVPKSKKRFAIDGTKSSPQSSTVLRADLGKSLSQELIEAREAILTKRLKLNSEELPTSSDGPNQQEHAAINSSQSINLESPPNTALSSGQAVSITPSTEGTLKVEPTTAPAPKKRFVIVGGGSKQSA